MQISIFDIPLILDVICRDLSSRDIWHCIHVCRAWHSSFSPYRWQTIYVFRKHTHKKFLSSETQETFRQHSSLLRSLTTHHASFFQLLHDHWLQDRSRQTQSDSNSNGSIQSVHSVFTSTALNNQSITSAYIFNNLTTLRALTLEHKHQNIENNCRFLWPLLYVVEACPRLKVLELGFFKYKEDLVSRLASIVENHPSLKDLTLSTQGQYSPCSLTCLLLQHCYRLERLNLSCIAFMGQYPYWIPNNQDLDVEPAQIPRTELRELILNGSWFVWAEPTTLLPLLAQCPNLERLALPSASDHYTRDICAIIRYHIHNLKHLDFTGPIRRDRDISSIIEACTGATAIVTAGNIHGIEGLGRLEIFEARNNNVAKGSIAALIWGHRMTLQQIDIRNCRNVSSYMLEAILRSCPNLTYFQAMASELLASEEAELHPPYLEVKDIEMEILPLQSRGSRIAVSSSHTAPQLSLRHGWVCRKLKVLTLQYEETVEEVLPKVLYHQISRLACLEELRIACKPSYRRLENTPQTSTTNMDTTASVDTLSGSLGALLDLHDDTQPVKDEGEDTHGRVGGTIMRERKLKILEEGRRQNMREALEMFQNELLHLRDLELRNLYPYLDPMQIKEMKRSSQRLRSVRYGWCL